VIRRESEQREARPVDPSPERAGQPTHRQRRDLDGEKQIERHDSKRNSARFPRRGHGDEQLSPAEGDITVGDQSDEVDASEDHCESSEMSVQIE